MESLPCQGEEGEAPGVWPCVPGVTVRAQETRTRHTRPALPLCKQPWENRMGREVRGKEGVVVGEGRGRPFGQVVPRVPRHDLERARGVGPGGLGGAGVV